MAGTLQLWGTGSGLTNVSSMVDAYLVYDELKLQGYEDKKTTMESKKKAWNDIKSSVDSLNSIISDLSGVGKSNFKTATVSSDSYFSVSAGNKAENISYSVTVKQLATSHTVAANKVDNIKESLNTVGEFKINGATISITEEDSLSSIVTKINSSINDNGESIGAKAYIINGALFIESTETGVDNKLNIEDTTGFLQNIGLVKDDGSLNTTREASNAIMNINGVDVERSSNTINDVIEDVEFVLTRVTDTPITVKVEENKEDIKNLAKKFVDTLNEIISKANKYTAYVEGGNSGILNGDTSVASIKSLLYQTLQKPSHADSKYTYLFDIGISTDRYGKFQLDEAALDKALNEDSASVLSLLTGGLENVAAKPGESGSGIFVNLKNTLNSLIGGDTNLFSSKQSGLDSQIKNYSNLITKQTAYIETRRAMLEKQFAAMETAMSSYNSQLSYFTSINNSNSKS